MKPDLELGGRVIVVAGAGGGGIGSATTLMLARAGAHVVAVDRSEAAFGAIRDELGAIGNPHRIEHVDLRRRAPRAKWSRGASATSARSQAS